MRRGLAAELVIERLSHDLVGAALHLHGRAARERQHQDARRIDAAHGQVRDTMRERIGLASAGTRDDQQRTGAKALPAGKWLSVGHRSALRSVEASDLFGRGHRHNNIREEPDSGPGQQARRDVRHADRRRNVTPIGSGNGPRLGSCRRPRRLWARASAHDKDHARCRDHASSAAKTRPLPVLNARSIEPGARGAGLAKATQYLAQRTLDTPRDVATTRPGVRPRGNCPLRGT